MVATVEIPKPLSSYIATRDTRLALKYAHLKPSFLANTFRELLEGKAVIVGGRASCGPACDPTWKVYTAWNEVVRKARKLGYAIEETNRPQPNKSPTMAGGFWEEREYRLA